MRMTSPTRPAIVGLALAVAACSGGDGTKITEAGPNGLPYGAAGLVASQTQFEKFKGTRITTSGSRATHQFGGSNFTDAATTTNANVTLVDNDTIRLELAGQTYLLNESGGVFSGTFGNNNVSLTPGFAGGSSTSVYFFRVDTIDAPAGTYSENFLVSGFETRPSSLPSGVATYDGTAGILANVTNGSSISLETVLNDADQGILATAGDGAMSMSVDFAATGNNVTGSITGTTEAAFGSGAINLGLTGATSGNSITGTITDNAANADLAFSGGNFTAKFYGPNGADVAGAFNATIDSAGSATVTEDTEAVGFFVGN